jgi:peptidoglycan/LPS O-acetylase OafA/YrhL
MGILVLGGLSNGVSGAHLWFNTIMAAIVLYVIYCNNFLQSNFVSRISRVLEVISFPVYLCQFALMISVTSYLIVWSYANHTLTNSFIFVIITTSIILIWALMNIFLAVERLTSRFGSPA